MLGYNHTAETKALMSKSQQQVDRSGENHPMYGKTHTTETKAAISAAKLGTTHTAESKALMSERKLGNTNGLGNTNASRSPIFGYEHDSRKLVGEYTSLFEASKSLEIPYTTLRRYLSNGKVWNNKFIIRSSPRPPSNPHSLEWGCL
jgi:group I intron endonuclease